MLLQVPPAHADEVIAAAGSKGARVEVIGEVTADDKAIFEYNGETVAVIPNKPSAEIMSELEAFKAERQHPPAVMSAHYLYRQVNMP